MPLKHKILYALAAVHIAMVALYASHFADWGNTQLPVVKQMTTVGDFTGSNNIFSFFAPALSDQPYVVYAIKDASGKEHVIDLKGNSPDFTNRINNIYGYLTLDEARSIFSASLAQFIARQYPDAARIRVAMVVQQIPTMEGFMKGERCKWRFWFHRDFKNDNQGLAKTKI